MTWNTKHPTIDRHYFASSMAAWQTSNDLEDLIKRMKLDGFAFNIWHVPVAKGADYQINGYAPQVKDAVQIAFYEPAAEERTK